MKKPIQISENKKQVVDLFPNLSEYPGEDYNNQMEKRANNKHDDNFPNKKITADKNYSHRNDDVFNQDEKGLQA